jgi:hypothetical protein
MKEEQAQRLAEEASARQRAERENQVLKEVRVCLCVCVCVCVCDECVSA